MVINCGNYLMDNNKIPTEELNIVNFDIGNDEVNILDILKWLNTNNVEWDTKHDNNGRIIGMQFINSIDATAFKIKFSIK